MANENPRRTGAAKAATQAAPQEAKAGPVDLSALAAAAQVAPSLPKVGRAGGGTTNPFVEKVRQSKDEGKPYSLPPVPDEDTAKKVRVALRRAAQLAEVGVSIREETTDAGIVITYLGKDRAVRPAR